MIAPAAVKEDGRTGRPLRVLLSSYACRPGGGSEGGAGWSRALETARRFETHVLCGEGEPEIRRWLSEHGEVPGLRFHFLPPTQLERRLVAVPGLLYAAYRSWQRRAFQLARALHAEHRFDLVHQATLSTYREPGYLWRLGIPFVWGPISGSENYPWRFLASAGLAGAVEESLRSVANAVQLRASWRIRAAARRAAVLAATNSLGERTFGRISGVAPVRMLDVGAEEVPGSTERRAERRGPLRLLWSGTFSHKRPFHLLVEALRGVPADVRYELHVAGSGPLEARWRGLARRAGLDCTFMSLPREEALAQYDWADALVFLSLRDACGSVVLEALAHGLPVICLDHHGAGDLVTDRCGVKVPVTAPREVIATLRHEIALLHRDRARLDRLGRSAVERAREHLWTRKVEQTAELYRRAMAR
jgi:glycosyltransferase involved in cell wall biosynthesis